jgi:hypothetical protein
MDLSTRTRRLLSTALAVCLAVESVSAVAAAAATSTQPQPPPAEAPAGQVLAVEATVAPAGQDPTPAFSAPRGSVAIVEPVAVTVPVRAAEKAPERAAVPDRAARVAKAPASQTKAATTSTPRSRPAATAASYAGTNHVWIPSLGISRSVRAFPCDRTRAPDNDMYRWGCAGANNVYLMGHASGVMAPLHDAYASGRLRAGMKAYYAGGNGTVHVYVVKWWKLTRPTTAASWAWAAQSVPSMTLQTCVGSNSEYRLMVRLVEAG